MYSVYCKGAFAEKLSYEGKEIGGRGLMSSASEDLLYCGRDCAQGACAGGVALGALPDTQQGLFLGVALDHAFIRRVGLGNLWT